VEIDFFDFGVGTHHEVRAPEKNREHSIGDQVAALNVGFMERLPTNPSIPKNSTKPHTGLSITT
ncbi:hypothetical protein ACN1C3_33225, partial [Pseudomonas sp. H11T01]|uniref:hypothetical protein n=1 Tax=Pseudomonas sp. H11T01 TaxID=3402749 RepID=UPI003ABF4771